MSFLMVDIIKKKRDGHKLTKDEIDFFIDGYVKGVIPDYQVSALMMAIFFNHLDDEETVNLTMAMMNSGDVLDLSQINGIKVDKHSTGGVGDKTSLVLTPMVASCGVPVAKMSGRGLGHTGGTIDKLESFPGFSTSISNEQFIKNVNEIGISIMGQTKNLAPADKLLYALRDVTATVDNMSLIASSIMSKKLAAGADAIVLDVKTGSGAFMKSLDDARLLAEKMVSIGELLNKKTTAVISDMDQPLGFAVGNSLEVIEAINTLKGNGPEDLFKLCLTLGSHMLISAGKADDESAAEDMLKEAVSSGRALDKLADFIERQGGRREDVYDTDRLCKASKVTEIKSEKTGYIKSIECEEVGMASLLLGGGRRSKEDEIDLSVGIVLNKKVGDSVNAGETLAYIHSNDDEKLSAASERLIKAINITDEHVDKNILIKDIIKCRKRS